MFKFKQLFIGIFIGAFIFSVMPVSAAVEKYVLSKLQYKIIVNGVEYKDDTQPALNYNGTTYVPLRSVGKLLGQEPRWNGDKKQVEIGIAKLDSSQWINLNDLATTYNVKISVGEKLTLEKLDKKYSMPSPSSNTSSEQVLIDETNNISFTCLMYKDRAYLKIAELKTAGIINN